MSHGKCSMARSHPPVQYDPPESSAHLQGRVQAGGTRQLLADLEGRMDHGARWIMGEAQRTPQSTGSRGRR